MNQNILTQDRLKELLSYDHDAGFFLRKGKMAGSFDKSTGYRRILVDGFRCKEHRLAWLYVYGEWPKNEIDHINHIKNDNRIENLRDVTRTENNRNSTIRKDNTSGALGVSWHPNYRKWMARISINGKRVTLGMYKSLEIAKIVRKGAELMYNYHHNHGNGTGWM